MWCICLCGAFSKGKICILKSRLGRVYVVFVLSTLLGIAAFICKKGGTYDSPV